MNLYLDIDGVLIDAKNQKAADGLEDFLLYITSRFHCFWLTTHCRGGVNASIKYLTQFLDTSLLQLLQKVRPTNWDTLKTEAIDFSTPFFWLDDQPFEAEKAILRKRAAMESLIVVDLKQADALQKVQKFLLSKL